MQLFNRYAISKTLNYQWLVTTLNKKTVRYRTVECCKTNSKLFMENLNQLL